MTITTTSPTRSRFSHPTATPSSRRLRLGRSITATLLGVVAVVGFASPAGAATDPVGGSGGSDGAGGSGFAMSWGIAALITALALVAIVVGTVAVARRASHVRHTGRPASLAT